ncbi:hypothetical protein [Aquipuribacter sp. SD81]|uniref:hypothetical protein n=1 Tax=Aquipuribacter sp. SD81 TaxID=3127703 RepID=UPI003016DF1F
MAILYGVLVVLHLVGMAGVVGGWLATVRHPRIAPIMWHGALTALVTGILLVGLSYPAFDGENIDNAKISVKLVVALVVAVLAVVNRRRETVPAGVFHLVGGLALLNVVVAVLWSDRFLG